MNIELQNIGKRFNREWIFRHINLSFVQGKSYAITGSNGSGKSTLLQILAGATLHNEGLINWLHPNDNEPLQADKAYREVTIAAPYLDLVEEVTAAEFLQFHHNFKALNYPIAEILAQVGLSQAANKQIRYFSSGMKQRLKLAQAFFSHSSILLLDEPTTNLDDEGIKIYNNLLQNYTANKLIIISSNNIAEYQSCDVQIDIMQYKIFS